ncbi:OmpA family protein [Bradymonas sediminis]|nr:OmpA family protein [Bradymonas sediminis]TDP76455.1 outer membrane protein OmpA-like peptidoglycan-associated protein [Bradymonas sediminis]
MTLRDLRLYPFILASLLAMAPATVLAQDGEEEESAAAQTEDAADSSETSTDMYEWKPSWGAGVEAGVFFNGLERWNANLLDGQREFDTNALYHFDAAVEASLLEGTRLSVFGGYTTPFVDNPSFGAWYIGVEPAFAFRRDMWEMAIGMGVAMGQAGVSVDPDMSADTSLVLLRPFLEVRRYLGTNAAVYLRGGFNQFLPYDVETDGLTFGTNIQSNTSSDELNEGGPYLALGLRFGSYPEHTKSDRDGDGVADEDDKCPDVAGVPENDGCPADRDGDGVYDTDDKCPDVAGVPENDGCPADRDGDGVYDTDDKCPDVAGVPENDGCPADTDGDGIYDVDDKCPELAGIPENDGCPADSDGDGVYDTDDKCPDVKGPAENNGCPLDSDGDGVLDNVDECPYEAGPATNNGCPIKRVVVTVKSIKISEKVFFALAKADIKRESYDLLDEIAQVMNDNPRIKKVEIQGHTDSSGRAAFNQKLSEDRAKSVYDYLVKKGVAEERLTSKGYGSTKPLVETPEGKKESKEDAAKNRRVEFIILEQDELKRVVPANKIPADAEKLDATDKLNMPQDAKSDDSAE